MLQAKKLMNLTMEYLIYKEILKEEERKEWNRSEPYEMHPPLKRGKVCSTEYSVFRTTPSETWMMLGGFLPSYTWQ